MDHVPFQITELNPWFVELKLLFTELKVEFCKPRRLALQKSVDTELIVAEIVKWVQITINYEKEINVRRLDCDNMTTDPFLRSDRTHKVHLLADLNTKVRLP